MATIQFQANELLFGSSVYYWGPLGLGDDGQPVGVQGSGDRTVQVVGTFGAGATIVLEGSVDMVNWFTLRDPAGSLLSFSAPGLRAILENVLALRPRVTAGDGTEALTMALMVRQPRNG